MTNYIKTHYIKQIDITLDHSKKAMFFKLPVC